MKFSKMIQQLTEAGCPPVTYRIAEDVQIEDFHVILGPLDRLKENTIYIAQTLPALEAPDQRANLILTETVDPDQLKSYHQLNYLLVPTGDLDRTFATVKSLFNRSRCIERSYDRVLDKVFNGKELSGVVDAMVEGSENSAVVIDLCGKIIAHSSSFYINDPMWIESINTGYCPAYFMIHLRKQSQVAKQAEGRNTGKAFTVLCEETGITYLCSRVMLDREHVGYSFMFNQENHFTDDCSFSLPMLSKLVSHYLSQNFPHLRARSLAPQSLLQELIENKNIKEPLKKIAQLPLDLSGRNRVICLASRYAETAHEATKLCLPLLQGQLQAKLYAEYDGMGVGICEDATLTALLQDSSMAPLLQAKGPAPAASAHQNEDALQARSAHQRTNTTHDKNGSPLTGEELDMTRVMQDYHLILGISKPFQDPSDFKEYYFQAKEAIRLALQGKTDRTLVVYEDVACLDFLYNLPANTPVDRYIHPALFRLAEEDQKHHTDLLPTLEALALSNFKTQAAADQLFIHRNTMAYRRKQIEDLCQVDLTDAETCYNLTHSLTLARFFKLFPQDAQG